MSLYAWLWRRLPGSVPVRAGTAVILVLLIVAALFTWVFGWIEARLPIDTPAADPPPPAASTMREPA